jgi:transposase-like protein
MPDKTGAEDGLDARPTRRTFTAEYKARILAEYEAATGDGEKSALLRRERLYYSHIIDWRKARDAGVAAGLVDRRQSARRAKRSAESVELERLRRDNARLEDELTKTRTALDIVGKAHALLALLSESAPTPATSTPSSPRRSRP